MYESKLTSQASSDVHPSAKCNNACTFDCTTGCKTTCTAACNEACAYTCSRGPGLGGPGDM